MALHYKFNIFILGMFLIQCSAQTEVPVQAFKVINASSIPVTAEYVIPPNSIAYTHLVSMEYPQAYIASWIPGVHGNAHGCQEREESKPLPIHIRISFDRLVSDNYLSEFFKAFCLTSKLFKPQNIGPINRLRHKRFRNEFAISIQPYYTKEELEVFIEKANIIMAKKLAKEASSNNRNYF